MKYGLSEKQLEEIIAKISGFPEIEEAVLFGSRAIDTFKEASDVDIALKGAKVKAALAAKLKFVFEEDTYLPFFFDFVAYPTITNEKLKEHINKKGVVIYRKNLTGQDLQEYRINTISTKRSLVQENSVMESPEALRSRSDKSEDGMKGWREVPFAELLVDESISYGIVQPGSHTEGDSVPIIRVNNIKNGNIATDDVLKVARSIEEKYKRTRLSGGELLITVVGSVGECAIVPSTLAGWNVARAVSVARIKEDVDKQFVKYAFKTEDVKFQMYGNTNDTVQPTLNLSCLKDIRITLPPLSEQRVIASVLSSLDDKIDLLNRRNKTLEAMAETLFRQWFVEEAASDEITTLGEFADNIRQNARVEDLDKFNHYVGLEHIPRKSVALPSWGVPGELASNKSIFLKNDILFGKLRSYFHKVVFAPVDGVCSTDILVIRPKKVEWFSFCLFAFFSKDVVDHSDLGSGGTRMPRTNWEILSGYQILKPKDHAIEEFDKIVRPMINKMSSNVCQIQSLGKLRDVLLPKLMSGEVKVST